MSRTLVAYASNSGSTVEVAQAIGDAISKDGGQVDVFRLDAIASLDGYDAAIVGAPMILGWHRSAQAFVKQHQHALSRIPVAYFFTAMSLTDTGANVIDGVPISIDPELARAPKNAARLSFKESYASASHYLRPVLKAAPLVKPVSVAFFGGKLELFRLKLWQMLLVTVIIRAQPGDHRNWPFIEQWARSWRT